MLTCIAGSHVTPDTFRWPPAEFARQAGLRSGDAEEELFTDRAGHRQFLRKTLGCFRDHLHPRRVHHRAQVGFHPNASMLRDERSGQCADALRILQAFLDPMTSIPFLPDGTQDHVKGTSCAQRIPPLPSTLYNALRRIPYPTKDAGTHTRTHRAYQVAQGILHCTK